MLASRLLRCAYDRQFISSLFATSVYTGSGAARTITNGIDLAGKGGMVWTKCRINTAALGGSSIDHHISDSAIGAGNFLIPNAANAAQAFAEISFNSDGYYISGGRTEINYNTNTFVSWTFRKAPKFFDCGTFVAGSATNRRISHALSVAPGMVILKRTDSTENWSTYHRSLGASSGLSLNTSAAAGTIASVWGVTDPTAYDFGVNEAQLCTPGGTYVWYAFAHDTSTDGLIQCGSFTTDGSGNASVNHGWSAGIQFAQIKARTTTGDWEMFDTARTPAWSSSDARLRANLSNVEDSVTRLSASGTSVSFTGLSASQTYIYVFVVAPT